ncbi:hypothetical protein LZ30DRAFT_84680 [Colletotrichum cereale]|nr:hypothetical protein LZ30DRAFT_84680 [Colletotrichum cereale]
MACPSRRLRGRNPQGLIATLRLILDQIPTLDSTLDILLTGRHQGVCNDTLSVKRWCLLRVFSHHTESRTPQYPSTSQAIARELGVPTRAIASQHAASILLVEPADLGILQRRTMTGTLPPFAVVGKCHTQCLARALSAP